MNLLLTLLSRYWLHIAAAALLGFLVWRGYAAIYDRGARDVQAKWDAQEVKDAAASIEAERRHQAALTAIAEKYEQDKRDAEEANRRLLADLRAGNVRLQDRWAGCVAQAGRSAAELDAAARDREESAARIVQAARDADAQIRGLQDVIRADRRQ